MSTRAGMPRQAAIAINDMLDTCGQLQPGQHVLILQHVDGLYGGPNRIDEQTVAWLEAAVQQRGAHPTVLWIDEPARPHAWRVPPAVKAALEGTDVLINNSFDLPNEEILELRDLIGQRGIIMVRNFATTAPLLASAWAQTPHELVSRIRYQTALLFQEGQPWRLTHPNGTHLEGTIGAPRGSSRYAEWRGNSRPFPEWVHPPVTLIDTEGLLVFDRMLSWWSRYIGIPPFFSEPIRLTIEKGRITKFEGGDEAEALRRFLASLAERFGDAVYEVPALHSGIHPQAAVEPHQCPDPAKRRWVEHSHTSNIHFHLGNVQNRPGWPYMLHVTGDVRGATFQVGDTIVHDNGRLVTLDDPEVRAVAERYPDRPGLTPGPWR